MLVMLLLILFSHFNLYSEINSVDLKNQNISSYANRFVELNKYISSKNLFKIGYITNCANADMNTARLYITQYVLAPVIVFDTPDMDYVVGNFCTDNVSNNYIVPHNLILKHYYGKGVMLLTKAPIK
jgi:hypothetical protein